MEPSVVTACTKLHLAISSVDMQHNYVLEIGVNIIYDMIQGIKYPISCYIIRQAI